jgi:hypothetical protein
MSDDDFDDKPNSWEETLRAIAEEVQRGIQRVQGGELDDIARTYGFDADKAKQFMDSAGEWLRTQAGGLGGTPFGGSPEPARSEPSAPKEPSGWDPLNAAGPDPLDIPTDDQGRALAALDSGRWSVEPGTNALSSHGDGPGPRDALGLVRELRVRDWIDEHGEVTLVGRAALRRWLED